MPRKINMLTHLRLRFIGINMVLAGLVLVIAFGSVCYIDYQSRVRDVYDQLSITLNQAQSPLVSQIEELLPLRHTAEDLAADAAMADDSVMMQGAGQAEVEVATAQEPMPDETFTQESEGESAPGLEIGRGDESVIPIAVYLVKSDGVYTALGDYASASISHSVLLTANSEALAFPGNSGLLEDVGLFFERRSTSNGVLIAYADESNANSWQSLAWTLGGVGVGVMVAFFFISLFFSWWALRPVRAAWDQQQQFVQDASHELKTPLAVILANMAILRSTPDSTIAEQTQWVESTQTEAERMRALVNDMLDLARPEDVARAEVPELVVDLTDLVETEVLQFESVAFERGVMLDSNLASDVLVVGSPERLQRMVGTLIDNACKYADADGNVIVTLTRSRNHATLLVANDGAPIPPEDLPHVFDRFYRADKARTSGKGGYGLGLAIAREVAREHNGDITVTSSQAEGTVFKVKLPLMD